MKTLDIKAGDRFGKLTILSENKEYRQKDGHRLRRFECKCDCGRIVEKDINSLRKYPYCQYCKDGKDVKIDSLIGEVWKDVVGFEGLYQISNLGRVKALAIEKKYRHGFFVVPEKLKTIVLCKSNGYPCVSLRKDKKNYLKYIHRLVAEAFIPNPDNKPCIDHIDTNILNFNISNLRWVSYQENARNPISRQKSKSSLLRAWTDGKYDNRESKKGRPLCTPVLQYSLEGEFIAEHPSARSASHIVCYTGILRACKGLQKQSGGYIWKFKKQNGHQAS